MVVFTMSEIRRKNICKVSLYHVSDFRVSTPLQRETNFSLKHFSNLCKYELASHFYWHCQNFTSAVCQKSELFPGCSLDSALSKTNQTSQRTNQPAEQIIFQNTAGNSYLCANGLSLILTLLWLNFQMMTFNFPNSL